VPTDKHDKHTVWVVDDDAATRSFLSGFLTSRGYGALDFCSGEHLVRSITPANLPSLLMLDVRMPRMGGLEILAELDSCGYVVPTIVLSGVNEVSTVVKAMRLGASDYLVKPLDEKDLEAAVAKVLEENQGALGLSRPALQAAFRSSSPRMLQVQAVCNQVAQVDVPVLILGESGAGKEVVARYIHAQSGRSAPFVKVNCAALPTDLLESELFGHERGAFTGAHREKPGKFELAGGGTLMLDEIAEMSPVLQAKLLHVLQDGEYSRLGGTRPLKSEARIIAATNKDLPKMVTDGRFREDLFFRLNVITMEVPPLRERPEDIRPLCETFVEQYRSKYKSVVKELPADLLAEFARYHWPGNVRQLENHVKRFLILPDLRQALLELRGIAAPNAAPPTTSVSLREHSANAAESVEKELIIRTLNEVNWNRKKAARRLDICYKSLLNKIHRWQLDRPAEYAADDLRPQTDESIYSTTATGAAN
jgi:two-component system, NtrC family, response regulator AtoC